MFAISRKSRLAKLGRPRSSRFAPRLDALEDRQLLATLTVTSPSDSGPGSLRAQVAAASSGDTIRFAPALIGQTITLTSGTIIDEGKSLTIAGPGATKLTVSGGGTSGIFLFTNGSDTAPTISVNVSGLTLADGKAEFGAGGAIDAFGTDLTVSGMSFRGNTSPGFGGAVNVLAPYVQPTNPFDPLPPPAITVTIIDSNFVGNSAGAGGAYQSYGATLNISGSTFESNTSSFGGGVLLGQGNATVVNSRFLANSGGALVFYGGNSAGRDTLDVSGSLFRDNAWLGGGSGGAINSYGILKIDGSSFENNRVRSDYYAEGGAVRNSGDSAITHSRFVGNRAESPQSASGGAVFLEGGNATVVSDTEFRGNSASGNSAGGGALTKSAYSYAPDPSLTLSRVIFTDNRAEGLAPPDFYGPQIAGVAQGGAVNFSGVPGPVTIEDSSFRGNQAVGGEGVDQYGGVARGGAIAYYGYSYGPSSALTIRDTDFTRNAASGGRGDLGGGIGEGGAMLASSFGPIHVIGGSFVANTASAGDGGASSAVFSGALGGAIRSFSGAYDITGTAFIGNTAAGGAGANGRDGSQAAGGAIFGAPMTITGAQFVGNAAIGGAGGAAVGSGVAGKGGDASGGAIASGNLTVSSSHFVGNAARGGKGGSGGATGTGGAGGKAIGGGISFDAYGSGNVLNVSDSLFVLDLAIGGLGGSGATSGAAGQGLGGGIAILNGTGVIKRTKFVQNKASTSGNNVYGTYTS